MHKLTAQDLSIMVKYAEKAREYEMQSSHAPAPDEYYLAMSRAKSVLREIPIHVE